MWQKFCAYRQSRHLLVLSSGDTVRQVTVIELRQYTLHPGQRDVLIEIFDREFVTGQEETGMRIIGQFRDLDDPDRFVWLRSFPDMAARAESLQAFYFGPVWREHREKANATMIDSADVLLLRPIVPFPATTWDGPDPAESRVLAVIYQQDAEPETELDLIAYLETEPAENTWPALPVRTGEQVLVWFSHFATEDLLNDYLSHHPHLGAMQVLRLAPTPGSRWH